MGGGDFFGPPGKLKGRRMGKSSRGAASEVRRIDPAGYQPPEPHRQSIRPAAQPNKYKKLEKLVRSANNMLIADANRRYGRRLGKRIRVKIVQGRYR
jgi:hypothetical protein